MVRSGRAGPDGGPSAHSCMSLGKGLPSSEPQRPLLSAEASEFPVRVAGGMR